MLQETHLRSNVNDVLNRRHFPFQIHEAGSSKARETAILLGKSLRYNEKASCKDKRVRYVMTKGFLNNELVTIVSIYSPNVGQIDFLEETFQKVSVFSEGLVILAGDFNYVGDLKFDRTYARGLNKIFDDHLYTALHNLIERYGFVDCWQHLHPTDRDYTYYSAKHKVHTHIDCFLMWRTDADKILKAKIGPKTLTDHN